MERHFQVVLENGNILESDQNVGQPMRVKPASFVILRNNANMMYFFRDHRKRLLGFAGGGMDIGQETPDAAAVREGQEEAGVKIDRLKLTFVGLFGKLEQVCLFEAREWEGVPHIAQPEEVSEVVSIQLRDVYCDPGRYKHDFYPAQWKMLGWYINHFLGNGRIPLFEMWNDYSRNPWPETF